MHEQDKPGTNTRVYLAIAWLVAALCAVAADAVASGMWGVLATALIFTFASQALAIAVGLLLALHLLLISLDLLPALVLEGDIALLPALLKLAALLLMAWLPRFRNSHPVALLIQAKLSHLVQHCVLLAGVALAAWCAAVVFLKYNPPWFYLLLIVCFASLYLRLCLKRASAPPAWKVARDAALIVFVSFLLALGALEILLRAANTDVHLAWRDSIWMSWPGARLITRPASRFTVKDHPECEIKVNAQGVRGPGVGPKEPGVFRILAAGDSFTMGKCVAEEKTFAAQMQRMLNERLPQCSFEVINFGLIGHAPFQTFHMYRDQGQAFAPDMVLHQVYGGNDLNEELSREHRLPRAYDTYLLEFYAQQMDLEPTAWERALRSRALIFLGDAFRLWRRDAFRPRWLPSYGLVTQNPEPRPLCMEQCLSEPYPELLRAYELVEESLTRMRDECRATSTDYFLFHIPDQFSIYPVPMDEKWTIPYRFPDGVEYDFEKDTRDFAALFQRIDVPHLCMRPIYLQAKDSGAPDLYLPEDRHLSEAGHRVTAQALVDALLDSPPPRLGDYLRQHGL